MKEASIYILATKGYSWISKIIRKWQYGYPYTHIAYVLNHDIKNDPIVIEAWQPKVRQGRLSKVHSPVTPFGIWEVTTTENQKQEIEDYLRAQVGKPYDFIGLFGFPFRRKDIQNPDKFFCSELVFTALKKAGIELLQATDPSEVSPRLLLRSPLLKPIYEGKTPL